MLHLLVTVSMLRVSVRSFSQVKNIRPASLESPMDVLSLFFTNFNLLNERSFDATVTGAVSQCRINPMAKEACAASPALSGGPALADCVFFCSALPFPES